MEAPASKGSVLKAVLPSPVVQLLQDIRNRARMLRPKRFEFLLYRAEGFAEPDVHDMTFEVVESGQRLTPEQSAFIHRDLSRVSLAHLRRWHRREWGCVVLAKMDGQYCDYMFCGAARRHNALFRVMTEPKAKIIGPGYTAPEFRGRNVHARVMNWTGRYAADKGYGPFYGVVLPGNDAANRAMLKSGWVRLGTWAGITALADHWARGRRIGD